MKNHAPQKNTPLYRAFFITVVINGLIALGDLGVGLFFLFQRQLTVLFPFLHHITLQDQGMGMLYFFSHSVVKLFLVWGLLTDRLWAYPLAIIFLSLFGLYQIVTLFSVFSLFTLLLLLVNAVTVFFIAREYRSL